MSKDDSRIYKGVEYWHCNHLSDEEMERIHNAAIHEELCECGEAMVLKASGGLRWICNSCGNERSTSLPELTNGNIGRS